MKPDTVILNARLRRDTDASRVSTVNSRPDPRVTSTPVNRHQIAAIALQDGYVAEIVPDGENTTNPWPEASTTIDAGEGFVTEPFVNGHLHLCKVYTLDQLGDAALLDYHGQGMGGAMTAIEAAAAVKKNYSVDGLLPGIRRALRLAVIHGISHIRAFADTDTTAGLAGIDAVMKGRDEFRDRVVVQAVAFPQDGILRDPGADDLVRRALEKGADAVGGIPWIELTDDDAREHVTRMLDLAVEFDRDVSMLVDDAGDAGLRTLETLAIETERRGLHGRVTAQHARAMALYPEPYFRKLLALLKRAGIGVISDPHTGPLHARVRDLRNAGIPVGLGQDDITDAYYPFGRNNMLEVAFLAAHLLWMTSAVEMEALYDMVTIEAARVLGIEQFELAPGNPANLVVHEEGAVRELLAHHKPPLWVLHRGRVVAHAGELVGL